MREELSLLQRAKATDKQQMQAQMLRMGEEVGEGLRQVRAVEAERDACGEALRSEQEAAREWQGERARLEEALAVARSGSVQDTQGMRDALEAAESAAAKSRADHASLLRHGQGRQAELERQIAELGNSLSERKGLRGGPVAGDVAAMWSR